MNALDLTTSTHGHAAHPAASAHSSPAAPSASGADVVRASSNVASLPGRILPFKKSKARLRVTSIKSSHVIGRLALALIDEMQERGIIERLPLRARAFTLDEIDRHFDEALRLARSYQPHVFSADAKKGLWS